MDITLYIFIQIDTELDSAYFLLAREGSVDNLEKLEEEHDYEEPYFEPASEEEALLQQLKKMSIPIITEESRYNKDVNYSRLQKQQLCTSL